MEKIRLQKIFTDFGIMSRRAAEREIEEGHVTVNGETAKLGDKADPSADDIRLNGKKIKSGTLREKTYIVLNKPLGYVTTAKDEKGRTPVTDLVQIGGARLYPVGRLDMDSDGLLFLTDDGDFANTLTHPRHEIPKIYEVTFRESPTEHQLEILRSPMELDGYSLLPVGIRPLAPDKLEMTLWEGRNRQIRRMCELAGLKITRLCRIAVGKIKLGNLPAGKWRRLTDAEVQYLLKGK